MTLTLRQKNMDNLSLFLSQWQQIAQLICQQGTDNLTMPTRALLQRWHKEAELLGLIEVIPLSQQLINTTESTSSAAKAFARLLILMQAIERSAISWQLSQPMPDSP